MSSIPQQSVFFPPNISFSEPPFKTEPSTLAISNPLFASSATTLSLSASPEQSPVTPPPLTRPLSEDETSVPQEEYMYWIEDLSSNGTYIDGKKIGKDKKMKIRSGAEFTLIPQNEKHSHATPTVQYISFILFIKSDPIPDEEAPVGNVTFVFTDIESSTNLWEAASTCMNVALEKHDRLLRKLLVRFKGYEVKTEGDAFMVAFGNCIDAIRWCVAAQKALLLGTKWPKQLLDQKAANVEYGSHGRILWNGLRVRMGLHTGYLASGNCRRNPVTRRMDYFGPVVNTSARVSDCAHGGQIICTSAVVKELKEFNQGSTGPHYSIRESDKEKEKEKEKLFERKTMKPDKYEIKEDVVVRQQETLYLKGIKNAVTLYQISPESMVERRFPTARTKSRQPTPEHSRNSEAEGDSLSGSSNKDGESSDENSDREVGDFLTPAIKPPKKPATPDRIPRHSGPSMGRSPTLILDEHGDPVQQTPLLHTLTLDKSTPKGSMDSTSQNKKSPSKRKKKLKKSKSGRTCGSIAKPDQPEEEVAKEEGREPSRDCSDSCVIS